MKDENRIDVLKTISMVHRSQFDQRRAYEWRVLFATLGIFATSTAAKLTGSISLPTTPCFPLLVWGAFLLLAVITSIYLYFIHKAHSINKRFAEAAEEALMNLSGQKSFESVKKEASEGAHSAWSLIWQIVTLVLFAVVCSFLITIP